ncbi:MAG: hypothetical protein V3V10_06845, partial [Planctomycetota bacterium]
STQITGQVTVTTGEGLAAGDMYDMTLTMLQNDANNPAAGALGPALEFHLTNTTGVAAADLVAGCVNYRSNL